MLKRFEQQKQDYELARLFYVACTRAKCQLHLFGSVRFQLSDKDSDTLDSGFTDTLKPPSSSLLAPLWPCVAAQFVALAKAFEPAPSQVDALKPIIKVSRLPLERVGFKPSALMLKDVAVNKLADQVKNPVNETLPGLVESALLNTEVGKLVHKVLEHVVVQGLEHWPLANVAAQLLQRQPIYAHWLTQQGVIDDLPVALARVQQSLQNALSHAQVRWALSNHWDESATELALVSTQLSDATVDESIEHLQQTNQLNLHVVDRTFVDDANTRWIIDYKTSAFVGEWRALDVTERQAFINAKITHYQPQLARYGALFAQLENRPQKWVLYFSDLNEWVELAVEG
ncbi:PD-(D/E)XK nuclease family protein [Thiomicrorhabdus aquaedulcis]|uniref:PD-(D/E)XK nuclease family protein n=1 Tax=Thiomicrorhabdus aquaedulcis TaxID=2211106 RepID=UPI000FD799B0|nr:PD-(D/E)XK nuclease family protein [Thiomicrorhabdus aquaedulcis]